MRGTPTIALSNSQPLPQLSAASAPLQLTRRQTLTLLGAAFLAPLTSSVGLAQDRAANDALPRRRKLRLEVVGTLELDPSGKDRTTSPFAVNGSFDFIERVAIDGNQWWVGRTFNEAQARITVGRGSTVSALSHPGKLVIEQTRQQDDRQVRLTMSRPSEPLTLDEMELIKLQAISPATSAWFTGLANRGLTDYWQPESWAVAAALGIEVVTDNQIQCRIKRRQRGNVEIEIRGTVIGTAGDVGTEISLVGTCSVNEATEQLITASWDIQEKRAIGPATPGFSARTRLELTDHGTGTWTDSSEQAFQQAMASGSQSDASLLTFESKHQGFRLEHSAKWTVIADSANVAILRFVDQGDLITQAHITRLQPLAAGTRLTPETYRKDVAAAIAGGNGSIVDVAEFKTPRGYEGLRVTVSAEVSGIPIQWIYAHVADRNGRRLGFVFTTEQDRLDRMGIEDQSLIDSMELLDLPASETTRAASRPATEPNR